VFPPKPDIRRFGAIFLFVFATSYPYIVSLLLFL
jgi:hypothetical protein